MNKAVKCTGKIIAGSAGFLAGSAAVYLPFVMADAKKNFNDKCDYLMILGGDIFGADIPSPQLVERMKRAAEYLNENPDVIAVPCGGCFRKEQKRSEAEIIASYLIQNGVSADRIILEDNSTTTFENFDFAIKIIENHSGKKANDANIAFLSSSYHIHRAGLIAQMNGLERFGRVTAPTPGEAYKRYIREYFVAYELLLRKLGIKK